MMGFNPDPKHPWTIEQVEAVATMLFDRAPANISPHDKWAWAAREAVSYLNARRNACESALKRDRTIANQYDKARTLAEEREKLPVEWPYEKAVKYITGENVWDRALKKIKQFALYLNKGDTKRAEEDLEKFRSQKKIKRIEVIQLRSQFSGFWQYHLQIQKRESGKKGGRRRKS
jgi:hypothetical protein